MKQTLRIALIISIIAAFGQGVFAQSSMISLRIIKNGTPITDTLDDGTIITFQTSSDDAEQENDEMDALYDDDLDAGWEGAPDDQNILTAGLRFQGVQVPAGAVIDSAFLVLTSHEAKSAEDVANITIVGENNPNPTTYTFDALITDRPETEASILWEVAEEWDIWTAYRTPDIKEIVQEIVDMDGWSYGNAMAFMLKGENQGPSDLENAREFESFENIADPEDGGDGQNHPERVPELIVYYSFSSQVLEVPIRKNGEPITDTLDDGTIITFQTSSDDAEQENDGMDALYDDDLDAGWEGAPDDQNILTAGLRFTQIDIPKGVNIDSAYIVLTSHEAKTAEDVARITIVGEASDAAETYNFDELITSRPETDARIMWEVAEEWDIWTAYRSPDISDIIQEIINREGWQSGNPVAIMLKGEDQGPSDLENAREFESFENIADPEDGGDGQNHPERVPRLVVYYSGSSSVHDALIIEQLHVYPNPANQDHVVIELKNASETEVNIYSQTGALVKSACITNQKQARIAISGLNNGVYFIRAEQDGVVYQSRLLINR